MSEKTTPQIDVWSGDFGRAYTDRNKFDDHAAFNRFYSDRFGLSRDELNKRFLDALPRDIRIVEVGCNIGNQLAALKQLGFHRLYGVELQTDALERARAARPYLNLVQGSALDLPFKDGFADLVFTSNVLIHIAPSDLSTAMTEMHRVSKRYVWGFEYYAPELVTVPYRERQDLLWKADYARLFLERFPDLKQIDAETYAYRDGSNLVDKMYLLAKPAR